MSLNRVFMSPGASSSLLAAHPYPFGSRWQHCKWCTERPAAPSFFFPSNAVWLPPDRSSPAAPSLRKTLSTASPRGMERPTPVKDAAVHRLAKSITQLTLCQVTTREVDDATKLLEKACQKLQGIQNIPSQRVTDLEATIRQLRQIGCILDSCTISASYEVSQAQKAILLLDHTAKGQYVIGRTQCTDFTTH